MRVDWNRLGGRLRARLQHPFRAALGLWIAGSLAFAGRLTAAPETGLDTPISLARGAFVATAEGPAAALTLPAALGFQSQKRTFSAAEFVGDRLAGGLALVARPRFAFYYRHFDNRASPDFDEDEYTLLLGGGDSQRAAGTEVRWMRNSLGGRPDALSFGFSLGYRPNPHVSLAYRGEHMNRPHYLDGRLDDKHTVSVGISPITAFTIASDVIFREDGGDDFRLRYGFELRPYRGLGLSAVIDNERGFAGGIGYTFGSEEAGYGITGSFDGGPRRHSAYIGHEDKEPRRGPPGRVPGPSKPASRR
jgi:hypothetical protein